MIGSIKAEWRKLRRRPAFWVSIGLLAFVVMLTYFVGYLQATNPSPREGPFAKLNLADLYPASFLAHNMGALPTLGGALAIVLGALVAGTEYQWGTLKTLLTQRGGRLQTLAGRLILVAGWMAGLTVLFFGVAAAASAVVAGIQGHAISWPAADEIARGLGASWLILYCYALLGIALGFLFRQSATAIGVGLIYVVLIQGILVRFLNQVADGGYQWATKAFEGQNAASLIKAFPDPVVPHAAAPLIGAWQATLVLAAYGLLFVVTSAALLRGRDVT